MNVSYNILFLIKSLYLIRRPWLVFTLYLYIVGILHSNSSHPIFFCLLSVGTVVVGVFFWGGG